MTYILRMTPPTGPAEYYPDGFGYTCHAHGQDIASAKVFDTAQDAMRRGNSYRWPPAFWGCELRHKEAMATKFRNWKFDAVPLPLICN